MRNAIFCLAAVIASATFNGGTGGTTAPSVTAAVPQAVERASNGAEEITLVYSDFPAGSTHLILFRDEDTGEGSLTLWQGQRLDWSDLSGETPDDEPDPPPADTTLEQVRLNFEAFDEIDMFDLHVGRLINGLKVPPAYTELEKSHNYIQLELSKILGNYAAPGADKGPHWQPWTDELMDKLTVASDLAAYTAIIDAARKGLSK